MFLTTWKNTAPCERPLATSAVTNSLDRMSATSARTVRVMIPVGITDSVIAGRMMCLRCSASQRHAPEPPGPAPIAGSQPR